MGENTMPDAATDLSALIDQVKTLTDQVATLQKQLNIRVEQLNNRIDATAATLNEDLNIRVEQVNGRIDMINANGRIIDMKVAFAVKGGLPGLLVTGNSDTGNLRLRRRTWESSRATSSS